MAEQGLIEISKEIVLPAGGADAVWAKIGAFSAIANWHPAIESCKVEKAAEGQVRTLALVGGGEIKERLEQMDDAGRCYTYTIVESPLPVRDYRSRISAEEVADNRLRVAWRGTFKASGVSDGEAKEIISGIYAAGLAGIAEFLGVSAE